MAPCALVNAARPAAIDLLAELRARHLVAVASRGGAQLDLDGLQVLYGAAQPFVILFQRISIAAVVTHARSKINGVPAQKQVQEQIRRHELRIQQIFLHTAMDGRLQ